MQNNNIAGDVLLDSGACYAMSVVHLWGDERERAKANLARERHEFREQRLEKAKLANYEKKANIAVVHWWMLCDKMTEEFFGHAGGHAGTDETAMVMAINPDLVDEQQYSPELAYLFVPGADVYPVPGSILLYKKGEGYPEFNLDKAKEYREKVIETVGDFIEMVAILMHIKARMLLPKPLTDSGDETEDPRTELVQRLIEYKRYKEAALDLDVMEEERRKLYSRKYFKFLPKEEKVPDEEYLEQVTLFNLLIAFKRAMDNMPKVTHHEVKKIDVTVEQQSEMILQRIKDNKVLLFQDLMGELKEKIVLIVSFIALLDLVRRGQVVIKQSKVFDDIRIKMKNAA